MGEKLQVVLAPHFRRMADTFTPGDLTRLRAVADLVWERDEPLPAEVLEQHLATAHVLIGTDWSLDAEQIARAKNLRTIIDISGAFAFDLDYRACFAAGIRVLGSAPAFGPMVAELTLAMLLAGGRGLVEEHEAMRASREIWQHDHPLDFSLFGKPIGLIGFGSVAREFRKLIVPFGCPVRVYDPWLPEAAIREAGCEPCDLDQLLSQSQASLVFAPPTAENTGLLDARRLALIPDGGFLAVVSRAHLVDLDALVAELKSGRIRAAIDVFPEEPLVADHPIRSVPNLILSSHRAASVRRERRAIGTMVVDDLELIARGLPPQRLQRTEPETIFRMTSVRDIGPLSKPGKK